MSPPSRRQFIRHVAVSLVALGSYPLTTRPAENNTFDTRIVDAGAIRSLASKLKGHLVTQGEPDYESARLVFNRAFDRHPALIIYCAGASDVARGLEFARNRNVPIAVRGGGHNRAGFSSCDNGVVLDLSRMNQVTVDAGKRIARADGGVDWRGDNCDG